MNNSENQEIPRKRGRPKGSRTIKPLSKKDKYNKRVAGKHVKEFSELHTIADYYLNEGIVLDLSVLTAQAEDATPAQKREMLIKYTNKLSLMGYSSQDISDLFKISLSAVNNYKAEARKRANDRFSSYDALSFVAETMEFYDEIKGISLRLANSTAISTKERIQAVNTAVTAENSKQGFLAKIGFLGSVKLNPAAPANSEISEKYRLLGEAKEIFEEVNTELSETCFTDSINNPLGNEEF